MIGWVVTWTLIIVLRYKQEILSSWREPVLKHPVLIFESDDWGAGPLIQAQSLNRIKSMLNRYQDKYGHHPVMTLGVILSVPDTRKIQTEKYKVYFEKKLDHAEFLSIKNVMLKGLENGVFDLQLHGMAHYWPNNLMYALQKNDKVKDCLNADEFLATETLPSVLQSRWTDTTTLPTMPLKEHEIQSAVREEVNVFTQIFGLTPKIVVPPTFVWTAQVESYWYEQSVEYLVTPGRRFEGRSDTGAPSGMGWKIYNSQMSDSGLRYIVRNDYFEPSLGHSADMAMSYLEKKTKLAQPTLLEIHRSNFIQGREQTDMSLAELEKVIVNACKNYPELMFLSTKELADKYVANTSNFIELSYLMKMNVVTERILAYQALKKWLYISGLILPFFVFKKILIKLS